VLISACLLGVQCRYDGGHALCKPLIDFLPEIHAVPFCPEQMGGLPTPRPPANIIGGDGADVLAGTAKCINHLDQDVTQAFIKGAKEAFRLAELMGARLAIGKDKSPSCGLATPYCESPKGIGMGVAAALLRQKGLMVWEIGQEGLFPTPDFIEILTTLYN